jgi:hypothetical protein
MTAWTIGMIWAGGLFACALWSREWARRKGLNANAWGWAGAAAGPLGVAAVGLRKAEGALCPHCGAPMRFEARYCPTCRALERAAVTPPRRIAPRADDLFGHGYFDRDMESEVSAA